MATRFLHNQKDFPDLIRIVGDEMSIDPILVEKDYWIMHCLYGLQQMGLAFELKGGTSLSKGLGIIERFSEDIDIRIEPPEGMKVATNPNQQKLAHVESRKGFYDWLADTIKIDGIVDVKRDYEFDDKDYYRSGGIRFSYDIWERFLAISDCPRSPIACESAFRSLTKALPLIFGLQAEPRNRQLLI